MFFHCGLVPCMVSNILVNTGSGNGKLPYINWTNADLLTIEPMGTNFNQIGIKIQIFPLKKMHLKMSAKRLAICP